MNVQTDGQIKSQVLMAAFAHVKAQKCKNIKAQMYVYAFTLLLTCACPVVQA